MLLMTHEGDIDPANVIQRQPWAIQLLERDLARCVLLAGCVKGRVGDERNAINRNQRGGAADVCDFDGGWLDERHRNLLASTCRNPGSSGDRAGVAFLPLLR